MKNHKTSLIQFIRSIDVSEFYQVRLGGAKDTLHLLIIASIFVAASPYFVGFYDNLIIKYLVFSYVIFSGGYAFYYIASRILSPLSKKNILPRSVKFSDSNLKIAPENFKAEDQYILGYSTASGEPIIVKNSEMSQHILVVGQSGVGKTVFQHFLGMQQIFKGGSLFYIDGKLDEKNKKFIWWCCCLAGRSHDFVAIDLGNAEESHTYNPLFDGDYDEKASRILSMIPEPSSSGSDHFRQGQLQGVMTVLSAYEELGWGITPFELSVVLLDETALNTIYEYLSIEKPNSSALKTLGVMLSKYRKIDFKGNSILDIERLKETFGGIAGRLAMFGDGNFGKITNTHNPDVRIIEALRNNKVVIVSLPTMNRKETAINFAKLFLADFRSAIAQLQALPEKDRPNPPALFQMDEMASYAIEPLNTVYEQARSAGISLLGSVQTISGLEKVSEGFHTMVTGNSWIKVFFQIGEPLTADYCSLTIGESTQVLKSLSESNSQASNIQSLRHSPESSEGEGLSLSKGERESEAMLVTPTELLKLGIGNAVLRIGEGNIYHMTCPQIRFTDDQMGKMGSPKIYRPRSFRKVSPESPLTKQVFEKFQQDFQRQQLDAAKREAEKANSHAKDMQDGDMNGI